MLNYVGWMLWSGGGGGGGWRWRWRWGGGGGGGGGRALISLVWSEMQHARLLLNSS